jgi:hypothetical protein
MPVTVAGVTLSQLGELQIHTGSDMRGLKAPERFYLPSQFSVLAEQAKYADQIQLQQMKK